MADTTQDAITLLKADHRKVEDLFDTFESAKGAGKKQGLVKQICMELTIHTIIEEEIFYPACRGKVEDDLLNESFVEHDAAKVMIAELEDAAPDEAFYDAKVKVLSEEIQHHVHEEEQRSKGLFAQAKAAGLDMDELGQQLATRKADLMKEFKADGLPPPETRTFAGHELGQAEAPDEGASQPMDPSARPTA